MDPINSWLDPEQVRKLAEGLTGPTPPRLPRTAQASSTPPRETPVPQPAPQPLPPGVGKLPPAPASIAGTALPIRQAPAPLKRFSDWLHQRHPLSGMFLLNPQGEVVLDEGGCGNLHFLARHARAGGNFRTKVAPAAIVEIIPLDTPAGRWVLGALVKKNLSPSAIAEVTEALRMIQPAAEQAALPRR